MTLNYEINDLIEWRVSQGKFSTFGPQSEFGSLKVDIRSFKSLHG